MKVLIVCLLLVGCATQRLDRKVDGAHDVLAEESYLRWDEGRLEKLGKGSPSVVECYKGDASETLEQYKKDYLTKKDEPLYWIHVGNCYFVEEKWSKAEFFYSMAKDETKISQVKAIALNNLGLIHFKYEQWEKGKAFLKESISVAPKFRVPRYNLSQLYLQFGLFDKAIGVLTDSVFKGPLDIDVVFSLANAYLFKGDLKTAETYFKQLPKSSMSREDIAATYALYLLRQGKDQEALRVIKGRDRSHVPEITMISQRIEKILVQRLKEE